MKTREISLVSLFCIKVKFDNNKNLMEYYNNNVNNISNDNLFDFLLTLIDEYDINYDYKGNVISEEPQPQSFGSRVMAYHLDFSPESCSKGIIYGFDYSL